MANCTTTSRLIYAKKKGLINNFSSKVCAIGFNDIQCFETLGVKKLTICHPEKSVIKKAIALNHLTFVDLNGFTTREIQVFDQTFVNITKSRKETLFNIAVAFFITKIDGNIVINGDVLFKGSFGRVDLPGGDLETLKKSIHGVMFSLPEETLVYCGHGPETTIGQEKKSNYIFSF